MLIFKTEYNDLKKLVQNVFNETPYFCITSDGWSNVNKAPIPKGIEECMISIGIDKFIAVITDNANNMKLAWRILKEKYADKIFLGCWANGINL
ncbi:hypothetical protein RhiirA4_455902 [Rhizophagus irregularis]|uniref:DUF659 domain-containing protein n=1 Tax=Rhizophagus irregularis TaxID=588596 RepID=A0A2I1G6B2_9GLOM|nr:hypothetical protein RhiirA4_455902 [Rhizophagus irregularis]